MAQIRSKQIADFLASVNWATQATSSAIPAASEVKAYVDSEISKEHSHHLSGELALSNEISDKISTEAYIRSEADAQLDLDLSTESYVRSVADNDLDASFTSGISTEAYLRSVADASLEEAVLVDFSQDLSTEAYVRSVADFGLNADLSTEISDRGAAVSTEAYIRSVADFNLDAALNTEISDRGAAVSTEAYIRSVADAGLANDISDESDARSLALSTEAYIRSTADATLNNRIDNVLSNIDPAALDSLTEVVSAFQAADGDLTNTINAVLSEHNNEFEGLSDAYSIGISTEIADRSNAVSTEAYVRSVADFGLAADLATEGTNRSLALSTEAYIRSVADFGLNADLNTEIADRSSAVSTEAYIRSVADAGLASDLADELEARSLAVSTEAYIRSVADVNLGDDISTEAYNRSVAIANIDVDLTDYVDAEISKEHSHHIAGDLALSIEFSGDMSTEAYVRSVADFNLDAALNTEISDRGAAVSTEAYIRSVADFDLAADLATEETNRSLAVSTEAYIRSTADATINTRIDNVLSNIDPAALDSLTEVVSAFQAADGDLTASIQAVLSEHNDEYEGLSTHVSSEVVSLEAVISQEVADRIAGDTYADEQVTGISNPAARFTFNTVGAFAMGNMDTEVYVNGVRVAFVQLAPNDFELNLVYAIEPTDIITVVGVVA